MNIIFYYNSSDDNKLNKSLTQKLNLSGNLREGTSIITPTITIQVSDSQYLNVIESNYAYISDFKRYYFITDVICAAKNLWDISMKVDVLMSFKNDILYLPVILDRNEYLYNKYLSDDLLPITNKCEIIYTSLNYSGYEYLHKYYTVDSFSSINVSSLSTDINIYSVTGNRASKCYNGNGIYVVTVLASKTSTINSDNQDTIVDNDNVTNNSFEGTYILNFESFKRFCINFNGFSWTDVGSWFGTDRYNEYVLSIRYYPINIDKIAWWSKKPIHYVPIGKNARILLGDSFNVYVPYYSDNLILIDKISCQFHYKYSRNSSNFFLNLKPYSVYEVYIPYYGYYELDISKCIAMNNEDYYKFIICYYLDYRAGKLLIKIDYTYSGNILYEESIDTVDFGFEVPVGSTNFTSTVANNMHQMTMNNISKAVSLVGIGVGAASGSGVSPVLLSGAVANTINNNRTDLRASIQGSGSPSLFGRLDLLYGNFLYVRIISKVPDKPTYYNHYYGLPTNNSGILSTFNGFTKIASTHIENIRYATDNERQIIMDKLTSGILLDPPST